jgi:hypothetical protein
MISAALAYHKHVGAGEAKLPRMLIYQGGHQQTIIMRILIRKLFGRIQGFKGEQK